MDLRADGGTVGRAGGLLRVLPVVLVVDAVVGLVRLPKGFKADGRVVVIGRLGAMPLFAFGGVTVEAEPLSPSSLIVLVVSSRGRCCNGIVRSTSAISAKARRLHQEALQHTRQVNF